MLMPMLFGENLFDDWFDGFSRPVRKEAMVKPNLMKTDVKEKENGFELAIELPGINKEDVEAELKDGYLTIKAETHKDNEEKDTDGKYIRRERFYGSTQRSFYVGEHINEEDISAKFENGLLKLFVPKKEAIPEKEVKRLVTIE